MVSATSQTEERGRNGQQDEIDAEMAVSTAAMRLPPDEPRRLQRREADLDRQEEALNERDRVADERDLVATERDLEATERDLEADERERVANERDRTADQREIDAQLAGRPAASGPARRGRHTSPPR